MRRFFKYLLPVAIILIVFLMFPKLTARAAESMTGKLGITYSATTGKMTAIYDGEQTLSGAEVYTWYKDGSPAGNGASYAPNSAGTYYCMLKDSNKYDGSITSTSITLYRATGNNITFDNSYGLYEAGDNVTVTATLSDGQAVANWKTSASGVAIPEKGQTVSFRMPAQSITVTASVQQLFYITVNGGTADRYEAYSGETVTITASEIGGKQFVNWSNTGGRISDPSSKTTSLTLAYSNVVVTANFKGVTSSESNNVNSEPYGVSYNGKADARHAVFQILQNNGYSVQISHHEQGPLCDAAFKAAQGMDWLVTDYFNITVNNSFSTYEISSPIRVQLTIPDDLIKAGRKWRMLCVSRNGAIYSFEDEDSNDSTITFSPDRFYAYAMCYNDIVPSIQEEIPIIEPEPEVVTSQPVVQPTSAIHSATTSQTGASTLHSANESVTSNTSRTSPASAPEKIKSDQSAAVERSDGSSVSLIGM